MAYVQANTLPCDSDQLMELRALQMPAVQEVLVHLAQTQQQQQQQINSFGPNPFGVSQQDQPFQVHFFPSCLGVWNTPTGSVKLVGIVVDVRAQTSKALFALDDNQLVVLLD